MASQPSRGGRTKGFLALFLLIASLGQAVIVDRVAVIVGNGVVKDSDIDEDLRVTEFLNNESPSITPAARKTAANRLVDQKLIRKEIDAGDYPSTPVTEAQTLLADLKKRYPDEAAYRRALASRRIDDEDVKDRLLWQLTVLRFIDLRFRPAALVTDEEMEAYYNQHQQQLQAANPGKPATLDALRPQIEDILTEERVNQLLDEWLDRQRKNTKILYLEEALK
jgi:hypothetical protein